MPYQYVHPLPDNLFDEFLGKKEYRVAVLGSFEAWPFIHKICLDVVNCGFAAVTSRYVYRQSTKTNSGYYRTKRDHDRMEMNQFLKDKVIEYCDMAIIVYCSPGTNYNEAQWCHDLNIRTLGINFTRSIHNFGYCEDCIEADGSGFSYCCGNGDAWTCSGKKPCPFKGQGISKSQLDYFLMEKSNMKLISTEKMEKTTDIINDFLNNKLKLPNKLVSVFEFRVDISAREHEKVYAMLDELSKQSEDSFAPAYEYIDYYYKPTNFSVEDWFAKKHSLRIRRYLKRAKYNFATVYYTQIEQTSEGFYCKEPFGGITWFEGDLDTAKKWLEDMGMDCFLQIIKVGKTAFIPPQKTYDTKFKAYYETIEIVDSSANKLQYGHSLEIELWTEKPKNKTEITTKKREILKFLNLESNNQQSQPVQEFITQWLKTQNPVKT